MLAAFLLVTAVPPLPAPPPPPPPGFGEPISAGPYIVLIKDDRNALSVEALAILANARAVAAQLPDVQITICVPQQDRRRGARLKRVVAALTLSDRVGPRIAQEAFDCTINGGSRRAPGYLAYQIDLGPAY